jgi:hypothetical protein
MPLSVQIPELAESTTTQQDFANFSKWWNGKHDKARQTETTGDHQIPSARRV